MKVAKMLLLLLLLEVFGCFDSCGAAAAVGCGSGACQDETRQLFRIL